MSNEDEKTELTAAELLKLLSDTGFDAKALINRADGIVTSYQKFSQKCIDEFFEDNPDAKINYNPVHIMNLFLSMSVMTPVMYNVYQVNGEDSFNQFIDGLSLSIKEDGKIIHDMESQASSQGTDAVN